MADPILCIWRAGAFVPYDARSFRDASGRYTEGEVVTLDDAKGRSKRSHDHFFVLVGDLHQTLPDYMAAAFPTPDSLRYYALCKAGYCDVETFSASSMAEAVRLAGFVRKGVRDGVQVVVNGPAITRLTPHSQSMKAMGGKVFQESKTACLGVIADLLGVEADKMVIAA